MNQNQLNSLLERLHKHRSIEYPVELRQKGQMTEYDRRFQQLKDRNDPFMDELLEEEIENARRVKLRKELDEFAEQQAFELRKSEAQEYFITPQFREDVIAELIAEGCTRLMAEGRTRDQARLFAEGARLNLM
jgi:hypothetical protein